MRSSGPRGSRVDTSLEKGLVTRCIARLRGPVLDDRLLTTARTRADRPPGGEIDSHAEPPGRLDVEHRVATGCLFHAAASLLDRPVGGPVHPDEHGTGRAGVNDDP